MEILLGIFIIGIVISILFLLSGKRISRDQGEETWNKWVAGTKNYKNYQGFEEDTFERKPVPDDYYQSEEYKKFCEERTKKYNESVKDGIIAGEVEKVSGVTPRGYIPLKDNQEEQVFYGERGGRYRIRYNKNGAPYRDYF